ncbi:hypothetical protein GQ600_11895 [Phytophthora cactorum]|nr:hypothetical protein GQ600_11895 [Phytophthora cactorum]
MDQQEEDWRDKILPLSPYQSSCVLHNEGCHRRKRSEIPSSPLVLQTLGPSPRTSLTKCRPSSENNDSSVTPGEECHYPAEGLPPLGLGLGSAESPLLYCKHQAPVPLRTRRHESSGTPSEAKTVD